jgi:hypothetical protein
MLGLPGQPETAARLVTQHPAETLCAGADYELFLMNLVIFVPHTAQGP